MILRVIVGVVSLAGLIISLAALSLLLLSYGPIGIVAAVLLVGGGIAIYRESKSMTLPAERPEKRKQHLALAIASAVGLCCGIVLLDGGAAAAVVSLCTITGLIALFGLIRWHLVQFAASREQEAKSRNV
jgi:hypothetical protein